MKLKYVGDMPLISKHGVSFDHTQPDKYVYLQAALKLLDALNYGETPTTKHLYKTDEKDISEEELFSRLKKYIKNIEELMAKRDAEDTKLANELIQRVEENEHLSEDERVAWLGNIKMMNGYFHQYITNKAVYEAALNALADEIHRGKIEKVIVPMFKNYTRVLADLIPVLESRKSPIDADLKIEEKNGELIATLSMLHR